MGIEAFDAGKTDVAWCPGCGNFQIRKAVMAALADLALDPREVVLVSGIGQAAKIPHYIRAHVFNGLHGRALSPATAIKAANANLTVIAISGDGDMYGEGGNHFVHTIRRNPNITNVVHNNMVYGLTKGQASPTSQRGFKTPVQVAGVSMEPFNPLAVAIALDAGFVGRAFSGDVDRTTEILKRALQHKGYALVDVFQPCFSFNKVNTFQWFKDNVYYLDDSHDPTDRQAAFRKATEAGPWPLGVFYVNPNKVPFEETTGVYALDARPLVEREPDLDRLAALMGQFGTSV